MFVKLEIPRNVIELCHALKEFNPLIVGENIRNLLLYDTNNILKLKYHNEPWKIIINCRSWVEFIDILNKQYNIQNSLGSVNTINVKFIGSEHSAEIVYGNQEIRSYISKDFSINSFFYNIFTNELFDYNGQGFSDLENKYINLIDLNGPKLFFINNPKMFFKAWETLIKLGDDFKFEEKTFKSLKYYGKECVETFSEKGIEFNLNKLFAHSFYSYKSKMYALNNFVLDGIFNKFRPIFKKVVCENFNTILLSTNTQKILFPERFDEFEYPPCLNCGQPKTKHENSTCLYDGFTAYDKRADD